MLTLLLAMALLVIFAAVIVPSIAFDIRRDREEELVHRGTQYSRAIRAYYKKFGRYPTRIEDLESANNQRFLRKRYKDPITGQDFKLLHFGEVKLTMSGGIGAGNIPGANPMVTATLNGGPSGSSGLSQSPGGGANAGFGGNSNSTFGQSQQPAASPADSEEATPGNPPPGPDSSQPGAQSSPYASGQNPQGSAKSDANSASTDKLAGVTFGGGPIVGVTSNSKKETIREFNHKHKYNEWQFIYDPATDTGFLIKTPNQPQLPGFGQQGMQNLNGQPGSNNSPFGSSPSGIQNNPNNPSNPGTEGPGNPPPNNPPQQQ